MKVAVHVPTQSDSDLVQDLLREEAGFTWWNGFVNRKNPTETYGTEAALVLDDKDLMFASVEWCARSGHIVVNVSEFLSDVLDNFVAWRESEAHK